jgi:hypothetical protein
VNTPINNTAIEVLNWVLGAIKGLQKLLRVSMQGMRGNDAGECSVLSHRIPRIQI